MDPASDPDLDATLGAVAPRLRDLRKRRNLTLSEVGEATGIGVSTLSRLESGRRRPSLDLLLPLARVYRVPLDDLVGAPPSGDPRIHPKPMRRDGMIFISLSRQTDSVHAFKIVIPGRCPSSRPPQLRTHGGYEWVYVLAGTLRVYLADRVTDVRPGEAAEFDTRTPHATVSADEHAVEILSLFSRAGERIHVHDE